MKETGRCRRILLGLKALRKAAMYGSQGEVIGNVHLHPNNEKISPERWERAGVNDRTSIGKGKLGAYSPCLREGEKDRPCGGSI